MVYFPADLSSLEQFSSKTHKFAAVKDQLIRRGGDLVSFKNAPIDELWEVKADQNGEFIVAKYEIEEDSDLPVKEAATRSLWQAIVKEGSQEVNLFYKGAHFARFPHSEANTVKNFLPVKLATDKSFLTALLKSFSKQKQAEVQKLYPELF